MPLEALGAERLEELQDDAGAAELRERIVGRARRDDRAVGQRLAGPVVIGDDDLEAARARRLDLRHGRDPAVDREDEPAAVVREALERLAADAVALLEAARQVPVDVGAEVAEHRDGERGRADPVDVVVAVDADALASRRSPRGSPSHASSTCAEEERVVAGVDGGEEGLRLLGVAVAPAGRGRLPSSR